MSLYTGEDRPRRIVMFGAGTGAETARRYFERDSPHEIVGYLVAFRQGGSHLGSPRSGIVLTPEPAPAAADRGCRR